MSLVIEQKKMKYMTEASSFLDVEYKHYISKCLYFVY